MQAKANNLEAQLNIPKVKIRVEYSNSNENLSTLQNQITDRNNKIEEISPQIEEMH